MNVVLLRHATRSTHALGDTPLNTRGLAQAEELAKRAGLDFPQPTALIGSPKSRAQETLAPLVRATGVALVTDPRLDERHNGEGISDFEARVKAALEHYGQLPGTVVLCTHLDWLEAALIAIPASLSEQEMIADFSPASYRIFSVENGLWTLQGRGETA